MPRVPSVLSSLIYKAIEDPKHLFENGIPVPSDSCWEIISKSLNHQITPKHLYIIVKNKRHNVHKIFEEESQIIIDNRSSDEECSSENNIKGSKITFNITLSENEWKQIGPTTKEYMCKDNKFLKRSHYVLEPYNWTTVIHEHFYEQTGIPCGISYKRSKVSPEGRVFVSIFGKCPSCSNEFTGEIEN